MVGRIKAFGDRTGGFAAAAGRGLSTSGLLRLPSESRCFLVTSDRGSTLRTAPYPLLLTMDFGLTSNADCFLAGGRGGSIKSEGDSASSSARGAGGGENAPPPTPGGS